MTSRIICIPLLLVFLTYGCNESAQESSSKTFIVSWENAPSWGDAPGFSNESLDNETSRFCEVEESSLSSRYFADGRISVALGQMKGEAAATRVARAVGRQLFRDEKTYRLQLLQRCRFGYYAYMDWGVREEKYTGHYVRLMIDLDKQVIWWCKCS